ncbi:MAG TPA: UvrB/UvrC motif-containing protein [Steroidobacteraceae bacterium]|nr:UvrB/UvrC motif-containing protein [Steroidobacteraceae bacterium]
MRAAVRAGAADRPGVYRMLSADGEVVYVGKSKRLRSRLLSYFRCAYPEDKGARILRHAESIDWEYTPSEFAALLQELRLIKRLRPRLNVALKQDGHNYAFVKITRGPAPKLAVVRSAGGDDGGLYYGPFVGARRVGDALRELNDALGLRDCAIDTAMHFSDQPDLFVLPGRTPGCIRHEIQKCLGPCIGGCSAAQYAGRVELARAFFDGDDDGPIALLTGQMHEASSRLEFERAATLRDKVQRLEDLREQFGRLRFAVETLSFLYTVAGVGGDDRVYVIRRGCVRAEAAVPQTEDDRQRLRALVSQAFEAVKYPPGAVPAHEVDELMLVSSWFRQHPDELDRARQA